MAPPQKSVASRWSRSVVITLGAASLASACRTSNPPPPDIATNPPPPAADTGEPEATGGDAGPSTDAQVNLTDEGAGSTMTIDGASTFVAQDGSCMQIPKVECPDPMKDDPACQADPNSEACQEALSVVPTCNPPPPMPVDCPPELVDAAAKAKAQSPAG